MLELRNVNLRIDNQPIISDLSFKVKKGDLVCLLGPSGCGKTTTLRIIAGFERPDSGLLQLDGHTVSDNKRTLPPHKRDIGFLFQDFALFPHLTIRENVAFGLNDRKSETANKRVQEILKQVRLLDHADKYPHMLSGGQQQRVALARALAPNPRLLLLDEPFSGLDTSLRSQIRDETLAILKQLGVTTLMVTHDPDEAMLLADRIILMRDGRMVQAGTPEELYLHPVDAFTAEFFGDINRLRGIPQGKFIHTALGPVANPGFSDGTDVEVLIRPEGLSLKPRDAARPNAEHPIHICSIQYLGKSSLIRLGVGKRGIPHETYKALISGHFTTDDKDMLDVVIDPRRSFVFAAADAA